MVLHGFPLHEVLAYILPFTLDRYLGSSPALCFLIRGRAKTNSALALAAEVLRNMSHGLTRQISGRRLLSLAPLLNPLLYLHLPLSVSLRFHLAWPLERELGRKYSVVIGALCGHMAYLRPIHA